MTKKVNHLALTLLFATVSSANSSCGDKSCGAAEYCAEDNYCNSCEDICSPASLNYDKDTCKSKCSDWSFGSIYIKREEFDVAVKELYIYMVASIVISIAALLVVLSAVLTVWLKYQRIKYYSCDNKKQLKKKMESIKAICENEVDSPKKLKLDMPVHVIDKDTPPSAMTTMTPLSRRHPSEDATLEYAYDNPTMTHSPVFTKNEPVQLDLRQKNNRTETSF